MAKIVLDGNVGRVETGDVGDNAFISFSLAERFAYFSEKDKDWIEKGTQWHDCVIWTRKDNEKKLERLKKFIVKGAGVLITGRTSINPSEEKDDKGNAKYLNPYIVVDDIALMTERLEQVVYKPKASTNNAISDPEMQQAPSGTTVVSQVPSNPSANDASANNPTPPQPVHGGGEMQGF